MQRRPILHDELELPEQLGAPWRVVEIYVEEALDNPYRALVKAVAINERSVPGLSLSPQAPDQ